METYSVLPLSNLSLFPPKLNRNKAFPSSPSNFKRRISDFTRLHCQKMYVPGFAGESPEAKAAKNLHNFFNYIAVRIVTAQLQSYNREAYEELMEFVGTHSLNDGDKFISELMHQSSRHKGLALRILEVRSAYCKHDFEWDNLKRLATKMVNECNTRLMRDYILETCRVESEE